MSALDQGAAGLPLMGQWAVVTGASKGIGLGIAEAVVEAGANVVVVARGGELLRTSADELQATAAEGQQVLPITADTSDPDSIDALFARVRSEIPHLNLFIANAGSGAVIPFLDITREQWDKTLALNLTGTFLCSQHAVRMMKQAEGANRSIVMVSSIRGLGIRPGLAAYSATKSGLNQLARVMAYELAPLGIRVNILSPGITATPLALEENPELFAERVTTVPQGRAGLPTDMAAAAVYLCSPGASFVTGTNLVVDGGESLW